MHIIAKLVVFLPHFAGLTEHFETPFQNVIDPAAAAWEIRWLSTQCSRAIRKLNRCSRQDTAAVETNCENQGHLTGLI